jgi:hypothetical protein
MPAVDIASRFSRRISQRKDNAIRRLLRRHLGPQCPQDPADIATVMIHRGIRAHVISPATGSSIAYEVIITKDQLGQGQRLEDVEVIDREGIS